MHKLHPRFFDREHIIIAGHRGAKALYPENTLFSFEKALLMGVDMLEMDLNMTADGHVVVIHDTSVDRTTNGKGPVRSFALDELKMLDAGGKFSPEYAGLEIPTFEEFCALMKKWPDVLLNVEIKDYADETVDRAMETLIGAGLIGNCVFTCFGAPVLHYIKDRYGYPTQGFPAQHMKQFARGENGTYSKMDAVGIEMSLVGKDIAREMEGRGILPWGYCPDDDASVEKCLESGMRLITVNNPGPALRVCKARGLRKNWR